MTGQVVVKDDPASRIVVDLAPGTVRWATTTWVPEALLKACAAARSAQGRAPVGDSHGSWQKVAEIPLAKVFEQIPPDALGDRRAWKRLLDDHDFRRFRCDGEHRAF